uniref:Uncharacterized protein n=1 Tax=Oryza meridionalis TaxID=40149 RepID=A0A0E0EBX8_9ORYZ
MAVLRPKPRWLPPRTPLATASPCPVASSSSFPPIPHALRARSLPATMPDGGTGGAEAGAVGLASAKQRGDPNTRTATGARLPRRPPLHR